MLANRDITLITFHILDDRFIKIIKAITVALYLSNSKNTNLKSTMYSIV